MMILNRTHDELKRREMILEQLKVDQERIQQAFHTRSLT